MNQFVNWLVAIEIKLKIKDQIDLQNRMLIDLGKVNREKSKLINK